MLTLTGPGGCGKTRLAIEVASQLQADYPDGLWWVELAPLNDPDLAPRALVQALGLQEVPNTHPLELLINFLKTRRTLLLLDNCEHLITACARLARALLPACPSLRILATSREPLGIAGETTWLVPSLSLPESAQSPADVIQYDAVHLFVERAAAILPEFALTGANAAAVTQICRRLDGMPLAIELAAARVNVLTVEQIATRLDDRFELLTSTNRTALIPRHQTLRAAIDWSYDLLPSGERTLLHRLSVFAGGFTLEAAEAVGAKDGSARQAVLKLLSGLVDKSLVVAETLVQGEARYHLLETIRQYAEEKLFASGEVKQTRGLHMAFYLALAEVAEPHLRRTEQLHWLNRLEVEHDNLRVALAWSLDHAEQAESALRLAGALVDFWGLHSYYVEGAEWGLKALKHGKDAPPAVKAKALMSAAWLLFWSGEIDRPLAMYEETAALYRALDDQGHLAAVLAWIGQIEIRRSNLDAAATFFEQALPIARAAGDQQVLENTLKGLGNLASRRGDHEAATRYWEECLAIERRLGDRQYLCSALGNLSITAIQKGDYRRAAQLCAEELTIRQEYGERLGYRYGLSNLATVAAAVGHTVLAVQLFGAAEARNRAVGVQWHPADQAEADQELIPLQVKLGQAAFEQAWTEGLAMSLEQAVELALGFAADLIEEGGFDQQRAPSFHSPLLDEALNKREVEILRLIAEGLTNQEIAGRLVLAISTVKWYINNLFGKLDVRNRTQAVARARELGLL